MGLPSSRFASLPFLFLFALVLVTACNETQPDAKSTVPKNGEEDVDPRSVVAVRLSNSVNDMDADSTDPDNFLVMGDLSSAPYTGTLMLANWEKDIFRGQTTDEFEPSANPPPPADGQQTGTTRKNDTIVFLLPDGMSFKEGETIHVTLRKHVKSHGSPLKDSKRFSFSIRSQGAASERLEVTATSPAAGSLGVSSRPRVVATFNRAVSPEGLAAAITLRGAQSGVHTGALTFFPLTESPTRVLEAALRLAADDAFLAGERVEVTWSAAIKEAAGSTPSANPVKLRPHHLRFQTEAGRVMGGWTPVDLPENVAAPLKVLAADFDPQTDGVEFVVLNETTLDFFTQRQPRAWLRSQVGIDLGAGSSALLPVDAVVYDMDSSGAGADGVPEVVVLLAGATESRLVAFQVDDSGELAPRGGAASLPVGRTRGLFLADLDASGQPELLAAHTDAQSGGASLFELKLIPPDPADIDPGNPDSLLPKLGFQRFAGALPGFEPARRIEAADLNGDGKLDLIAESDSGLVLYENFGTAQTQYALRAIARLLPGGSGRGGTGSTAFSPLAWVVADLDGDGDQDILLWQDHTPLLYRNDVGEGEDTGLLGSTPPAAESLPGPEISSAARVEAVEVDGDGVLDLVILETNGGLNLLRGKAGEPLAFDTQNLAAAEGASHGMAVADLDGDTGVDVVLLAGSNVQLALAHEVTAPQVGGQSTFEISREQSTVRDDILEVVVVGNIAERFSGYGLALDYDESFLTYRGFVRPAAFPEGKADFTLCPDANLQGCAGNASAVMMFSQATQHPAADGILLGTFRFRVPDVTEARTTTIELKAFQKTPTQMLDNTLRIVDGSATVEIPVTIEGGALELAVEPPPPAGLVAECSVLERQDTSLRGRVSWSSPAGATYSTFEIQVGGQREALLPGTESTYEFITSLTGVIGITVKGLDAASAEAARADCNVIGIHRPLVDCVALSETQNRFTWSLHPVDRFALYKNGGFLAVVGGTVREFTDAAANPNAAEIYEVSGVVGDVDGPRGICAGGPVGDPDAGSTLPPRINSAPLVARPLASSPNSLGLHWTNGEGYSSLDLALRRLDEPTTVHSEVLPGTQTDFTFKGDESVGGVLPGFYEFALAGTTGTVASETVRSARLSVPVPTLAVSFTCAVSGSGDFLLTWDPVWRGYSDLKLLVESRIDGVLQGEAMEIPLSLEDTRRVLSGLSPIGVYTFKLVASYVAALPAELVPVPGSLEKSCVLTFAPGIRIGRVETGVGLQTVELPVTAEVVGRLSGFRFTLQYPEFLVINAATGLKVDFAGGQKALEILPGDAPGTRRAAVTVSGIDAPADVDGDGVADEARVLATLIASVPADFDLPAESRLAFSGATFVSFPEIGERPVSAEDGTLIVHRRFVSVDRAQVRAGSTDVARIAVRATFDEPVADYSLIGFTVHIKWDPTQLELLPVRQDDQAESAIFGRGTIFLPTDATFSEARARGELTVPWLAIDFSNPEELDLLEPGQGLALLFVKFRTRLSADTPTTFAPISFVTAADCPSRADRCNPTVFIPTLAVPNEPDLQGVLGGGILVVSDAVPLRVQSVSPTQGSLLGGNEAVLTGVGFPASGGVEAVSIDFLRPGAGSSPVVMPVTEVLEVTPARIRFLVPDSGLRSASLSSTAADIRLTVSTRTVTLEEAYSYVPPRLLSADLTSGRASGGQVMRLGGAGLARASTAAFRLPGVSAPFAAEVVSVTADGTDLRLLTPDLRGHVGERATVEVTVPGVATVSLADVYEVLPDDGQPAFRVSTIDRDRAFICGGQEVVLGGEGFQAGLAVSFGGTEAAGVSVLSSTRALVLTPAVPEGTGAVTIRAVNGGGAAVNLAGAFHFEHPGPSFIRGDVDQSGKVSVTDAVMLSDLVLGRAREFPANLDAADANDDGALDGGDVTAILDYLFGQGSPLSAPFGTPGLDPTPDALTSCP